MRLVALIRGGRRESTHRFASGDANRQSDSRRATRIDRAIKVGRLESTKRREPAGPNRYTDSNRKRKTFRIFVRFRSADLSLFLVRIGRPELKNNSIGKRSKSARIDKVILDRRELKIDSSRPPRTGQIFKSADPNWKHIQVGRLEARGKASRLSGPKRAGGGYTLKKCIRTPLFRQTFLERRSNVLPGF